MVHPQVQLPADGHAAHDSTVAATLDIFVETPRINSWIFDRLRPWCGERVLEVGSGIGTLTTLVLDREAVVATDVDDGFVAELSRKFADRPNVTVARLDLEDLEPREWTGYEIDTILCVNVLEHVQKDGDALAGLAQVARPGGRLLLYVPALPWLYGSLDRALEHHRRYARTALRGLLERCGWRILHESYMNLLGIPGWFVNSRILRRRLLPAAQVRLYDYLTPILRLEDALRLPIGMSLVMVGERP